MKQQNSTNMFFPNLDGLRFLAFFAVFINHVMVCLGYNNSNKNFTLVKDTFLLNGDVGVSFFFVLSGFLITYLLLKEKDTNGKINIKNFYFRRVLRIFPIYYLVVIIGLFVIPLAKHYVPTGFPVLISTSLLNKWYYLTFTGNIDYLVNGVSNAVVGVLWSVSIEEQFYLFWPLLIAFIPNKYLFRTFIVIILSSIAYRYFFANGNYMKIHFHFFSCITYLAMGAIVALMATKEKIINGIKEIPKYAIILIYLTGIVAIPFRLYASKLGIHYVLVSSFVPLFFSCFFGFVIMEQNFSKNSFYKMEKFKRFSYLGKYTYGMYCYHIIVFFIVLFCLHLFGFNITGINKFVFISIVILSFIGTVYVSKWSYKYFEIKFLNMKEKFSVYKEQRLSPKPITVKPISDSTQIPVDSSSKMLISNLGFIIFILAFILYAQSIKYDYAYDDAGAIKDNFVTKQGIKGIPTILKTDYWYGNNYSGPIYRPTSLIMFAIEWQLSPNNPHLNHFINVLLFSLSCWLLFILLCRLFREHKHRILLPFIFCLLYLAHPIHTEVVDNIKSRDEILTLLFGVLSTLFILNFILKESKLGLALGSIFFFLCLLSKESGIVFLILIPLIIYVFTDVKIKKQIPVFLFFASSVILYFAIRHEIFKNVPGPRLNAINNTLYAAPDFISRQATAFYILLKYLWLLIFPHPLSCDYSWAYIKIQSVVSPVALFSILLFFGVTIFSLFKIRKKNIFAFSLLFFLIAFAPVSNIFMLMGSTMADRFMYVPSIGFCLLITLLILKFIKPPKNIQKVSYAMFGFFRINSRYLLVTALLFIPYTVKTIVRSRSWENNTTLFSTDVKSINNSAFLHYFWGLDLYLASLKEKDTDKKSILTDNAIVELTSAINIWYDLREAHNILGKCYKEKKDYLNAIKHFEYATESKWYPKKPLMFYSLASCYLKLNRLDSASAIFDSVIKYDPNYANAYNDKGYILMKKRNYSEAIPVFTKSITLNPQFELGYFNLGLAYFKQKQFPEALENFIAASQIDPTDAECFNFIGKIYEIIGNPTKAKEYFDKEAMLKKK